MVRVIKWTLLVLLILVAGYAWSFFSNLKDAQASLVKKGAVESLEGGSLSAFTTPIVDLIKADLTDKKEQLLKKLRLRAKKTIFDLLDDEAGEGAPKPGDLHP